MANGSRTAEHYLVPKHASRVLLHENKIQITLKIHLLSCPTNDHGLGRLGYWNNVYIPNDSSENHHHQTRVQQAQYSHSHFPIKIPFYYWNWIMYTRWEEVPMKITSPSCRRHHNTNQMASPSYDTVWHGPIETPIRHAFTYATST